MRAEWHTPVAKWANIVLAVLLLHALSFGLFGYGVGRGWIPTSHRSDQIVSVFYLPELLLAGLSSGFSTFYFGFVNACLKAGKRHR